MTPDYGSLAPTVAFTVIRVFLRVTWVIRVIIWFIWVQRVLFRVIKVIRVFIMFMRVIKVFIKLIGSTIVLGVQGILIVSIGVFESLWVSIGKIRKFITLMWIKIALIRLIGVIIRAIVVSIRINIVKNVFIRLKWFFFSTICNKSPHYSQYSYMSHHLRNENIKSLY